MKLNWGRGGRERGGNQPRGGGREEGWRGVKTNREQGGGGGRRGGEGGGNSTWGRSQGAPNSV